MRKNWVHVSAELVCLCLFTTDLLMFAQSRNIHWHFGLDTSTRIAAYLFVHDVTIVDALSFVLCLQCLSGAV